MVSDVIRCILRRKEQISNRVKAYRKSLDPLSESPKEKLVNLINTDIDQPNNQDFDSWPEISSKIVNLKKCWEVYALGII
jgi:hypothetical protein